MTRKEWDEAQAALAEQDKDKSWLERQAENFVVGSAGIADAIFDTHLAAQADAAFETGDPSGVREKSNEKVEDSGGIGEAWKETEKQIADKLTWGTIVLTIIVVLGVAIGTVYAVKQAGV